MAYTIEVQRRLYTVISRIHVSDFTQDDIRDFIGEIITIGTSCIREGLPCLYHILVADEARFDLMGILRPLNEIRRNDAMITLRKQLNMMTILVGSGMQNLQFTQHMMSTPQYGGRPIAILPTLDLALEAVQRDLIAQGIELPPSEAAGSTS